MKTNNRKPAALLTWIASGCLALSFAVEKPCSAAVSCLSVKVRETVRIPAGELTLADLLSSDSCARLRTMAQRVALGAAPLAGAVRVLQRSQVRGWLEALMAATGLPEEIVDEIPQKVLVRRAGAGKSCAEIAGFVLQSLSGENRADLSPERFSCAAAQSLPETAPLELTKTFWNPSLLRWEFSLRCSNYQDCAPFLVWADLPSTGRSQYLEFSNEHPASFQEPSGTSRSVKNELIKRGQTATLRWDEPGIRIVLPVICLEGGAVGQTIRARFKNAARVVRAHILSDGTLWAGL